MASSAELPSQTPWTLLMWKGASNEWVVGADHAEDAFGRLRALTRISRENEFQSIAQWLVGWRTMATGRAEGRRSSSRDLGGDGGWAVPEGQQSNCVSQANASRLSSRMGNHLQIGTAIPALRWTLTGPFSSRLVL